MKATITTKWQRPRFLILEAALKAVQQIDDQAIWWQECANFGETVAKDYVSLGFRNGQPQPEAFAKKRTAIAKSFTNDLRKALKVSKPKADTRREDYWD